MKQYNGNWVEISQNGDTAEDGMINSQGLNDAVQMLATNDPMIWSVLGNPTSGEERATWFISGTMPDCCDTPIVLVLIIEENAPSEARVIGETLIQSANREYNNP